MTNQFMRGMAPAGSSNPSDNIFVGSVPYEWTEAELNTLCGPYGTIVSSVILTDRTTGKSRGAGMVKFADVSQAAYAVQSLNGYVVEGTGRRLAVNFAERPEEKGARKAVQQVIQQLRFSPYGQAGAGFGRGGMPMPLGGPRGPLAAIQSPAVGPMSMNMFGGAGLPIVVPKRQDITPEEGANLHIFGLDTAVTDLHLYQAFAPYGAIRSVRVMVDPATQSAKGFGFVQYYNVQDAMSAIAALNGSQVGSRMWQISVHQKKAPTA